MRVANFGSQLVTAGASNRDDHGKQKHADVTTSIATSSFRGARKHKGRVAFKDMEFLASGVQKADPYRREDMFVKT
jgi:hypothetical protein